MRSQQKSEEVVSITEKSSRTEFKNSLYVFQKQGTISSLSKQQQMFCPFFNNHKEA